MKRYEAHIALAHQIGDPIEVTGSPVSVIPDGVRFSRRLRDLVLYRAMLGIIDDVVKQAAALPNDQADAVWMKMFPTYHLDEDLGPVAAVESTLGLSRHVVRINAVYSEFNGGHPFLETTPRMMKRYNRTSFIKHDPRYTMVDNGVDPAAIRVYVPVEYVTTFPTDHIWCHYIPVPTDPSTQTPEETLDFEPMYYNSILNKANLLLMTGNQDYQSAETMQMIVGGN